MGSAAKGSANPFFKSKYADLNAIREACLPALFANGLSVMQPTVVIDGKSYIETLIIHESGEFIGGHTEIVYAKQNDAQNFGAGTTYARRFGLQSLLCIGAEDDDGETSVGRTTGKTVVKTETVVKAETAKTETVADVPKKGGFGVKKPETVAAPTTTDDGWA
jgi:hypothetical protein